MRRVLVPLDGSALATEILPDAQQLAGNGGEIVLMQDIHRARFDPVGRDHDTQEPTNEAQAYLEAQAANLRDRGARVQAQTVVLNDVSLSIDEAARIFGADMIACATHGRGPVGRLVHGGVVWRALAHSTVPVMVRHYEEDAPRQAGVSLSQKRLLVPLDGSPLAETALPLAIELAREWNASLFLLYVVPEVRGAGNPYGYMYIGPSTYEEEKHEAQQYLDRIAGQLGMDVHTRVVVGNVLDSLVAAVNHLSVTDIVMASHGRTALSRVILGSVADALVHRLTCPIIIIPALAAKYTDAPTQVEEGEPIAAR